MSVELLLLASLAMIVIEINDIDAILKENTEFDAVEETLRNSTR